MRLFISNLANREHVIITKSGTNSSECFSNEVPELNSKLLLYGHIQFINLKCQHWYFGIWRLRLNMWFFLIMPV